jgi:hypothetical protein
MEGVRADEDGGLATNGDELETGFRLMGIDIRDGSGVLERPMG